MTATSDETGRSRIRTPDQRLRVFVSSTMIELAGARAVARSAVEQLRLSPVMFELGARPHPPRDVYRAYLEQSDIFIGIYWQSYGWVAPGEEISGLDDELQLAAGMPRLLYVKEPAPEREPGLAAMLAAVRAQGSTSYKHFTDSDELAGLILDDLALLLSERFDTVVPQAADTRVKQGRVPLEPANPLIGREAEMATALAWLVSGTSRLVTLTGPGGVGKSRVALELAKQATAHFPDGVWTVLLEAVRDPALVMAQIARTVNVRGTSEGPVEVVEALRSHLAGQKVLLVLDNFEHVLPAATDLAALLEDVEGLVALVTSRTALRVRAERELPVPPLPQSPAVELFLARARAVNPNLVEDEDNLRAVQEICRRLDGLPLAIELAAARVRLLPPRQLLRRLEQRLSLLTGGTADMPERHQTLRATIDWGHELLDEAEQVALRRLAVFAGGWTMTAAEDVLTRSGDLGAEVLDVLDGLVTKSFVTRPSGDTSAPRFRLLETIREYAQERLEGSPDLEPTVDAHVEFFLGLAEHAAPELNGPDQTTWLAALEADHDNLLAVLRRLEDRGDMDRVLRLTVAIARLWWVHSHISAATYWLRLCVDVSQGRTDALRADLLTWANWLELLVYGNIDRAEAISREALRIRRDLGDRHGEAVELLALGNVATYRGDVAEARRYYRETWQLAEATGDTEIRGRVLTNLGVVARTLGHLDEAQTSLEGAVQQATVRGDEHSATLGLSNLAGVHLDRGDLEEAERLARETILRCRTLGDDLTLHEAIEHLGAVWALRGRLLPAGWLFGAADQMVRSLALVRSGLEAPLYERYVTQAQSAAAAAGLATEFQEAWTAGTAARRATVIDVALGAQPAPV